MSELPPFSLRIGRRVVQLPLVVWLVAIWQLMWDRISIANLLSGLAVALALVLVFPFPPLDPGLRLHPLGLVRFFARFAADLLRSAGPLTWQAFGSADRDVVSSVVGVTLRTRSDLILTAMAIALSAVPGTLVVDVRRGTSTLFLHVLGADHDAAVAKARQDVLKLETRVVRAFGTREDLRAISEETP
ncbi:MULTISPECIES: Na+/H+ antiporter subunit E [Thermomonosporaceae]|uniref:Na+/H+ antiporter subunit E n=1 Tax=Thermomonosporaceae TaxID=2012 RepID=UPI00255A9381|nr:MULTISPECIES: Na+/H+ antiporter subunit E [Thermomonosporaceae]MDL4770574.1 Na+/H+ antiporter subunit E [Actinomadura xylanilytica]